MRKLLVITMLFSMNAQAIDIILGGISHHIGQKRYPDKGRRIRYNSNHRMKGIGFKYGDYYLSAINYTNSFYTESTAVSVQYKYKDFHVGGTIANGYEMLDASFLGGIMIAPSISYRYKYIDLSLMGDAMFISFSIPIGGL